MASKTTPAVVEERPAVSLLAANVKSRLGTTRAPYRLDVRHLWGDRFRVNVLASSEFVSVTIAQSYFIIADEKGNIVSSTPEIVASV